MDWVKHRKKVTEVFRKNRYWLLVLALGILLMALPDRKQQTKEAVPAPSEEAGETGNSVQQSLEDILSQIAGAGEVRVLLTISRGSNTVYQTDQSTTTGSETASVNVQTVLVTGQDRSQSALIRQVEPPVYMGAVVVCQGGGDSAVRLAIVEAVASATGLGADKITVLKMK